MQQRILNYCYLLVKYSQIHLAVIGFLFCLGTCAEQEKILLRKRAADLNKKESTRQTGEEFDVAFEILGISSRREIKASITLTC